MSGPDPLPHVWWLSSRASGIVALLLVTISVAIGLTMSAKLMRRPGLGPKLVAIHEQTALAGLIAIGVHGVTLLGDPWLDPSPIDVAVPFLIDYKTFFTSLGIVGGWLAAFLGMSFYFRRRIGPARWRGLHRWTVAVYVLGLVHTIGAGTDASTPWLREFVVLTAVPLAALFAWRMHSKSAPPAPRTASPPATQEAT